MEHIINNKTIEKQKQQNNAKNFNQNPISYQNQADMNNSTGSSNSAKSKSAELCIEMCF